MVTTLFPVTSEVAPVTVTVALASLVIATTLAEPTPLARSMKSPADTVLALTVNDASVVSLENDSTNTTTE